MLQEEIINTVEGVGVGVDRVSEAMEVCEEEKVKKDVVEAEKPSSAPPSVGFSELFRFSDGLDYILMTIGTIGAIIHGCSLPLFLRFFADLVNSFGANANDVDKMMDEVLKIFVDNFGYSFVFLNIINKPTGRKLFHVLFSRFRQSFTTIEITSAVVRGGRYGSFHA